MGLCNHFPVMDCREIRAEFLGLETCGDDLDRGTPDQYNPDPS